MEPKINKSSKNVPNDFLISLLDKTSEDLANYRQKRTTIFREAAIVQALITWGVAQLKPETIPKGFIIEIFAGISCILIGFIGVWIIQIYNRRVNHMRQSRQAITDLIQKSLPKKIEMTNIFIPIEPKTQRISTQLKYQRVNKIYCGTLVILGLLTCVINFIYGFAHYAMIK